MDEALKTYQVRVSGIWNPRHTLFQDGEEIGTLIIERKGLRFWNGKYVPKKGEVLFFRRDPGVLRGQFSLWTEGREWLGSSLRWHFWRREFQLSTGSRPYRVLPLPGLRRGWRLCAPKTGEMARFDAGLFGRGAKLEVFRRMDPELLVFFYFLGTQVLLESLWPGPGLEEETGRLEASKA